ncbi:MAG: collagen-like protein [Vigna little leaf phytoplasma]|nr:collagen-like protein [Vigna little leaf phytoplasma]
MTNKNKINTIIPIFFICFFSVLFMSTFAYYYHLEESRIEQVKRGLPGVKGEQVLKGERGEKGDKGEPGKPGETIFRPSFSYRSY